MTQRRVKPATPPSSLTAAEMLPCPAASLPVPDPTLKDKQRISQAMRRLRFAGSMRVPFLNDETDARALELAADFLEAFVDVLAQAAERQNLAERELRDLQDQRRAVREFLGLDALLHATQAVEERPR